MDTITVVKNYSVSSIQILTSIANGNGTKIFLTGMFLHFFVVSDVFGAILDEVLWFKLVF